MQQDQPILLDVSRSIWRASSGRRATGIDRVCLSYIKHYGARAQAVFHYKCFHHIFTPSASFAIFNLLIDDNGKNFKRRFARLMVSHLPALARRLPGNRRPYLNVGHTGLDDPSFRKWLDRSDVCPIYMVHDLIPITHPEYARPGELDRHSQRMVTVLETASGIILNSRATFESLKNWARDHELALPPTQVIWLGTANLKTATQLLPEDRPYFVTLGTIEGRKNHLMLLNLWRDWVERGQTYIPKLVIVGQRGWAAEQTFSMLDRCPGLAHHVIERRDCGDAELTDLIANARALLFPSFAEGYGMPLVEAIAAGVPVIASDLLVFREIAGSIPTYCNPTDGKAWSDAIFAFVSKNSKTRANQCEAMSAFTAPTWAEHFEKLDLWLSDLKLI